MNKICINHVTQLFSLPDKKELIALNDTNLCLDQGELVVIIGRSGCGKTTLLNLLAGLLKPSSGSITVDGLAITSPHYSRMMMFRQPCLLPWLTVAENIAFGCKLRGEKEKLKEKVNHYIDMMGLTGFETVFPNGLSAGMMQRVTMARCLIGEPEILLMDESFSDVDILTRATLYQLILDLWQRLGLTILLVTHDIEEALLLGQRIVLMGDRPGRILNTFHVPLPYPRHIDDSNLLTLKREILENFNG